MRNKRDPARAAQTALIAAMLITIDIGLFEALRHMLH
jgi:hypothetical protein